VEQSLVAQKKSKKTEAGQNCPASKYSRAIAPKHPGRARPGNRGNFFRFNEDSKRASAKEYGLVLNKNATLIMCDWY
jgi:hypothetical protein